MACARLAAVISSILLVGCSDPADKTTDAKVGDAVTSNASQQTAGAAYKLTSDSKIGFTGSKVVSGSHDGGFNVVSGSIAVSNGTIAAHGPITIDMNSIWTDNEKLTGHLKNKDFFEVETYPTSTFTITSITTENEVQQVTGNLEMHGITKSITFPAHIAVSDDSVTLQGTFDINRKLWDIKFDGMPDNAIRDNVVLRLNIVAVPDKA